MKFQIISSHYFGFNPDLSITDIFEFFPEFFENHDLVISRLDSSRGLKKLTRWIQFANENRYIESWINDYVYIKKENVSKVFLDGETFFGFDEVYLFKNLSTLTIRKHFAADMDQLDKRIPPTFPNNFFQTKASRYLCDGMELNFVCDSFEWAEKLSNYSL